MKIKYIRNSNASHMVMEQSGELKDWEKDMVRYNPIEGILFAESTSENGLSQLWYDITGKQALDVLLENMNLDYELLYGILSAICNMSEKLEALLLKTENLLLAPETIFIDYRTCQVSLCFYPGNEEKLQKSFSKLMEFLLTKLDHKDEAAVELAYDIYEQTKSEGYSLFAIFQKIRMPYPKEKMPEEEMVKSPLIQEVNLDNHSLPKGKEVNGTDWKIICVNWVEKIKLLFSKKMPLKQTKEEPFVFTPEMEEKKSVHPTVLLSELSRKPEGILRYEGEEQKEDFLLDKFPYLIGSDKACAGHIPSETVSRKHARITREEDVYFIEDLNSSNGTSVNGELLNYRVKMSLQKNDIIIFADEKFRFI